MRVLQVHSPYRVAGGEDRVVALEAEALRSAGHVVHQHVVPNPTALGPTLGLLAQSPYNVAAGRAAVAQARAAEIDVAHVHNTWFALSPSVPAALSRAGFPVVATMHNYRAMCINGSLFRNGADCTECVGGKTLPGVRHGCYENRGLSAVAAATVGLHRRLGTWTDRTHLVLVPSEASREAFLAEGFDPSRLRVVSNFTPDPGPRTSAPSASRTLLFVGRLWPEKGLDALMRAWRQSAHEGLELLVVGEGPLLAGLREDPPPGVRLTGAVPPAEVARLMLRSRGLVFPSLWREPFGLTLIEAMAAGLPVAGFRVGDADRIVGDAGLLVDPGDVAGLAALIDSFADDALVDELGTTGRRDYLARHGPLTHTHALEAAYDAALATRARPDQET